MKLKLLQLVLSIALGFFTGILLSGNGIDIQDSGVQILLGCILWILIFIYLRLPLEKK
ncbi:hypothetical protein [Paenibacillus sp. YPG26]|uniref:hypothetical protein n=1 Tax=Paenibacillus sp. YPG26 TaxID=2878915 RepID=UPI00203EF4BE|nr:hypothetical protein [Paenibacillus sp. YPG26]USB33664.1 hypothetical protein LDO05_02225 [Paenibacillus sp. YPG26]